MDTIRSVVASTSGPVAAPRSNEAPVAAEQPAVQDSVVRASVAETQSLASHAPTAPTAPTAATAAATEDKDWGGLGRTAAIIAGVVGGAAIAGAVAYGCAMGGMNVGGMLMGSLYREALPRVIGLTGLMNTSNQVLMAAPLLGAVAGGITGALAGKKKQVEETSDVPGSGLARRPVMEYAGDNVGQQSLRAIGWVGKAVVSQFREAGENVHEGVNGIGDAKSLGEAVKSGASASYAFASRAGQVGGRVIGIAQGAYLGALLAGMPFAFAPLTAIPIAIVGAWGISTAMSKVGGVVAGSVAAAGGAVVGAVGYGIKKAVGGDEEAKS